MANLKVIDTIRRVCIHLDNGRNLTTIFEHANGEMHELAEELNKFLNDQEAGPDGVVGEAIDVILCMMDIIHTKEPAISNEYIYQRICEKLDKWERLYQNGPVKEEDEQPQQPV